MKAKDQTVAKKFFFPAEKQAELERERRRECRKEILEHDQRKRRKGGKDPKISPGGRRP